MKTPELPYLLAETGIPYQFLVERKVDKLCAGYISKDEEKWEVEQQPNVPKELRLFFESKHEAALFVYMKGRAYLRVVEAQTPPKLEPSEDDPSRMVWRAGVQRIEIRVTPNFGRWDNCNVGEWVASLYQAGTTTSAGRNCCSRSLEQAKQKGLRLAHYLEDLEEWCAEKWEEDWEEVIEPQRA